MQSNYSLIQFITECGEKRPDTMSWYDIGLKFGVTPPDKKRSETDRDYYVQSIARKAQQIWDTYIKQKNNLSLVKETYINGKLNSEVFRKDTDDTLEDVDLTQYELEKITIGPYGPYRKYRKIPTKIEPEDFESIISKQKIWSSNNDTLSNSDNELMVILSDTHIGAKTSNGKPFTVEVYKDRLKEIVKRCAKYDTSVISTVKIVHLGDWMDSVFTNTDSGANLTTRGGHAMPQGLTPKQAFEQAYLTHVEFIKTLSEVFSTSSLEVIMLTNSNHDSDTAFAASTLCKLHLSHVAPHIKYTTVEDFIYHCKVQNVEFLFSHGKDREYMKRPLPRILNEAAENFLVSWCLDKNINPKHTVCVSGDQHNFSDTITSNIRYVKCPSLFGSSEHATANYGNAPIGFMFIEVSSEATTKSGVRLVPEFM